MKIVSLLVRGIAFWLGVFNVFALGWSTLSLSSLPIELPGVLSVPITLSPAIALIVGSLIPDKALLQTKRARTILLLVLIAGLAGCAVVAVNNLMFSQGPNMYGFWFQFAVGVVLVSLFMRMTLARQSAAQ